MEAITGRHYPGVSIRATATSGAVAGLQGYGPVDEAGAPGSGGVAHRTPVHLSTARFARAPLGLLLAGALVAVWLLADPRTPDLAAAVYRVDLFGRVGFAVWDERWYAGHSLPGYSLLFPALGSLLGVRLLGALSVLASAALFETLVRRVYGPAARRGAALFAVAAVGDVWSGRLAFALGVPFALAAGLVLVTDVLPVAAGRRESAPGARHARRGIAAGVLALLCAAASPVAGALLALAGLTYALWAGRRSGAPASRRHAVGVSLSLVLAPAVLVLALVALFPEGGTEPYPILSFAATALALGAFVWALPTSERLLRFGAAVYLLACLACLLVHSPVGSNVERYGVLLAGPLLLCARLGARDGMAVRRERNAPWLRRVGRAAAGIDVASVVALVVIMTWVVWGPVRETLAVAGNESTAAAYYQPLERFLAEAGAPPAQPVRVEVPLTRSHWEAALLAPSVSLARGWEKQLDSRYDQVLLTPGLTAAAYDRWLHQQAVAYVALPDTPLDPSSAQEGRLIAAGLPYLRLVFASRHWRVYRVLDPTPLASGPGTLTTLGDDSFALRASSPGSFDVRVRYSRYLTLARGSGCVGRAPGGWTNVTLDRPGPAVVTARFSLARAFAGGPACTAGAASGQAASLPAG
jgi:hypothetical protein